MKTKITLLAAVAVLSIGAATITSCGGSEPAGPTYKLVIAGMTDTEERRQSIDFTNPYYQSELVLVCSKTDSIDTNHVYTADELRPILEGKTLVSQNGTETYRMLDIFVEQFGAIKANAVDSFTTAAINVMNDKAFAFTAELPVAQSYVNGNPDKLVIMHIDENILGPENLASLSVSIGIKKNNSEFVSSLNTVLDGISTDERNNIMTDMVQFNEQNNEPTDNIRTKITGTNGTIVVGLECNYPSFNWTEVRQNNYTYPIKGKSNEFAEGYDVEIAIRLATALNMTLEIQKMEWDALIAWVNV